jgi:peptide deformylase
MNLLFYPDKSLETKCEEVTVFDESLHHKLDKMKVLMLAHEGMGLAANQVGLTDKMFIMKDKKGTTWEFINPVISHEYDAQFEKEACLSFPGIDVQIKRFKHLVVKAQDRNDNQFVVGASDLEAICIQHEMDHLSGITFLNHLSRQQRREVLKRIK